MFKGTQFFTSGVGMTFIGAMHYYHCYYYSDSQHAGELRDCIDHEGPGSVSAALWVQLTDYIGSVLLVWSAFLVLPKSVRCQRAGMEMTLQRSPSTLDLPGTYCWCLEGV